MVSCAFCGVRYVSGYNRYPLPHRATRIAAFVFVAEYARLREAGR